MFDSTNQNIKTEVTKVKKRYSNWFHRAVGLTAASVLLAGSVVFPTATVKADNSDSADIMVGTFFTSEEDTTDTLYWSTDGVNFYYLSEAYTDATPNDNTTGKIKYTAQDEAEYNAKYPNPNGRAPFDRNDQTLHDPSIIYRDGYFWMLSGNTTNDGYLEFMVGFSKDLVRWSYPTQLKVKAPVNIEGTDRTGGVADMVAPDFMVDDDGTVYIVASLGYYASKHGGNPEEDQMQPYLIKVNGLTVHGNIDTDREAYATATLDAPKLISLPCRLTRATAADDHIDGSLVKENGYYYLSIKENGVTNEIFRIADINKCNDTSAWEQVSDDVITGYEGPCLTKYNNEYFMYVDRLSTYTPVDAAEANGSAGMYVIKASSKTTGQLDKYTGWLEENVRELVMHDANGNVRSAVDSGKTAQGTSNGFEGKTYNAARHGTVITVTGTAAATVRKLAASANAQVYNAHKNDSTDSIGWSNSGWYKKESYRAPKLGGKVVNFWYENDVRQGVNLTNANYRGKEIYDPAADAWCWLDAKYDGQLATASNTYDENGNFIASAYQNGDYEVAMPVDQDYFTECGYDADVYGNTAEAWKWVRYDWQGKMLKGDYLREGTNKWYHYDAITGAMQKGLYTYVNGNGDTVNVYYDITTGVRVDSNTAAELGYKCEDTILYTEDNGIYEDGQGGTSNDTKATLVTISDNAVIAVDANGVILSRKLENTVPADIAALPKFEYKVIKKEVIPENGWYNVDGCSYWYENGVRQGYDPDNESYRGKEIYDPESNAWYWLDNVDQGKKAVSKDVYQESSAGEWGDRTDENGNKVGKWVRYDAQGHMVKGWCQGSGESAKVISSPSDAEAGAAVYYFDPIYGTMAKGTAVINGITYNFNQYTGVME